MITLPPDVGRLSTTDTANQPSAGASAPAVELHPGRAEEAGDSDHDGQHQGDQREGTHHPGELEAADQPFQGSQQEQQRIGAAGDERLGVPARGRIGQAVHGLQAIRRAAPDSEPRPANNPVSPPPAPPGRRSAAQQNEPRPSGPRTTTSETSDTLVMVAGDLIMVAHHFSRVTCVPAEVLSALYARQREESQAQPEANPVRRRGRSRGRPGRPGPGDRPAACSTRGPGCAGQPNWTARRRVRAP